MKCIEICSPSFVMRCSKAREQEGEPEAPKSCENSLWAAFETRARGIDQESEQTIEVLPSLEVAKQSLRSR